MLRTAVLERLCAPLCDAVLGRRGLRGGAGLARAHEPLPAPARRPPPLVPLPPPVRPAPAGRAGAARAGARARAAPARVRVARASGTTEEAIHHAVAAGAFAEAGALIAETWVHYANAGRTASVLDWLARGSRRRSSTPTRGCCWSRRGCRRCAAARTTCAPPPPACARSAASTPARCPTASPRSSRASRVLGATFGWGDVSAILDARRALGRARGPGLAVAAGDHLGARLGALLQRRPRRAPSAGWRRRRAIAPPADQWIVGVAAIADLSLIAGLRGRRDEQLRLARGGRRRWRARSGCSTRVEDGEVHTAHGVALAAHGRPRRRSPALEQGVFLRRLWGQPLDLVDGLIELARPRPDRRPRRAAELFAEAEALLAGCRDPGALPARLAAARRAAGRPRPPAAELTERELTVLRLLDGGLLRARDRPASCSSPSTPSTRHVKAVYRKLGVSSRAEAVARPRFHLGEAAGDDGPRAARARAMTRLRARVRGEIGDRFGCCSRACTSSGGTTVSAADRDQAQLHGVIERIQELGSSWSPSTRSRKDRRMTPDTIVLIHGFWVTPRSWEHWIARYEAHGLHRPRPRLPGLRGRGRGAQRRPRADRGRDGAADHRAPGGGRRRRSTRRRS